MTGADTYQRAADAFGVLSNEFRVEILQSIYDSSGEMSFSEIADAVEERDSGRLTYHLDKLGDLFVTKDDDGYRLTYQGKRIASSIIASRYFDEPASASTPVAGTCFACGSESLALNLTDSISEIRCSSCDTQLFRFGKFPLSAWESRDPAEVPEALHWRVTFDVELTFEDVCYDCYSPLTREVWELDEPSQWSYFFGRDLDFSAVFDCKNCTNYVPLPYWELVWYHPSLESTRQFLGVTPRETPVWEVEHVVESFHTEVLSETPFRVKVHVDRGNRECTVVFDDQHEVERVDQTTRY